MEGFTRLYNRFIGKKILVIIILLSSCLFLIHYKNINVFSFGDEIYTEVNWNGISELPKPAPNTMNDKWIVITTVNHPTEDVKKLAKLEGWKMVVVGDTKTPKDWHYPNCVYLSVEDQLKLGYKTISLLNYKSYQRKNIGYLYAIEHGAKLIYDTDDDNSPTTTNIGFDPFSTGEYLVYQAEGRQVVNPYAHFGQGTIWPRGYPLDKISDAAIRTYRKCSNQRPLVQQGVVDGDPDVDAIFRLTRKDKPVDLKVEFDSTAKPALLPKNVMAPYNSQNTLHLYDAFWGLVLPQTVTFRVCDIWRGYWAQRLFWEIDGHVAFFPPNAYTFRNAHDFLDDMIEETELYTKSSYLVDFLINWKATKPKLFDRVVELSVAMYKMKFWDRNDVLLVKYWLQDLIKIGYKPPKILEQINNVCQSPVQTIFPREKPSSYLTAGTNLKHVLSN